MSQNKIRKWILNTFCLSLLLHILLLLSFSFIFFPYSEPHPHEYIPSYVYTASSMPSQFAKQSANVAPTASQSKPLPQVESKSRLSMQTVRPPALIASSFNWLQQNQAQAMTKQRKVDPILLVGDKNESPDPLIRALAKALSAHFQYPREEGMWGIKGRVIVEMTLHPNGSFTDVNIVQSSNNHNLDLAALYAVNSAPRVIAASKYLSSPKHFVVGFGFY